MNLYLKYFEFMYSIGQEFREVGYVRSYERYDLL